MPDRAIEDAVQLQFEMHKQYPIKVYQYKQVELIGNVPVCPSLPQRRPESQLGELTRIACWFDEQMTQLMKNADATIDQLFPFWKTLPLFQSLGWDLVPNDSSHFDGRNAGEACKAFTYQPMGRAGEAAAPWVDKKNNIEPQRGVPLGRFRKRAISRKMGRPFYEKACQEKKRPHSAKIFAVFWQCVRCYFVHDSVSLFDSAAVYLLALTGKQLLSVAEFPLFSFMFITRLSVFRLLAF